MKKRLLTFPLVLLLAALMTGCIIVSDDDPDSSLTIENASVYDIYEVRVSPSGDANWGPDLLGSTILAPGDVIIVELDCDTYDAQVVDQDGVICELYGLDLCFEDAIWTITTAELNSCF